jgi:ferredoxin
MPELDNRLPQNVTDRFYVDSSCIDCDQCRDIAPAFFRRDDDEGMSYVHQQPESEQDIALCEEAMNGCPTESIGGDG